MPVPAGYPLRILYFRRYHFYVDLVQVMVLHFRNLTVMTEWPQTNIVLTHTFLIIWPNMAVSKETVHGSIVPAAG